MDKDSSIFNLEFNHDRLLRRRGRRRRRAVSWIRSRPRAFLRFMRRPPVLLVRVTRNVIVSLLAVLILVPFLRPSYTRPPPHYLDLASRCKEPTPGCANVGKEKVFISVTLHGRDGYLGRGPWGHRVVQLVSILGPANVYLSVYENGSGRYGKVALEYIRQRIECRHRIISDDNVSLAGFPNVTLPDRPQRTKRVTYVSELRNRALQPLDMLDDGDNLVVKFDKVLFLDDIAFRPLDAAHLLFNTNTKPDGQTDYLAACALDHSSPFHFHDAHALRDADGFANTQAVFPLFSNQGRGLSRADMLSERDAVRVRSCWSGMTAVRARHVQNTARSLPDGDFRAVGRHVIDPARPTNVMAPVRFRHEPEVWFDASECYLFMADIAQAAAAAAGETATATTGIYVNPYVRAAYSDRTLHWLAVARHWERLFVLVFDFRALFGLAAADGNPYRDVVEGQRFGEEVWDYDEGRWRLVERVGRPGLFCGMRGRQLIDQGGERGGDGDDGDGAHGGMLPGQMPGF